MEPIAIVKKRSRMWLIMIVMIVALLTIAAALWFMGDAPASDFSGVSHHTGRMGGAGRPGVAVGPVSTGTEGSFRWAKIGRRTYAVTGAGNDGGGG